MLRLALEFRGDVNGWECIRGSCESCVHARLSVCSCVEFFVFRGVWFAVCLCLYLDGIIGQWLWPRKVCISIACVVFWCRDARVGRSIGNENLLGTSFGMAKVSYLCSNR